MGNIIDYLSQIWNNRELRLKIGFVLALLVFIRFLSHIPIPQIDRTQLLDFMSRSENQVFGVLSMFTGGSFSTLSIDMMGVGPYITASIIVQLLTKAIPAWEAIQKEGTAGRERLNQYTRYLTPPLAIIQGYGSIALLRSQNVLTNVTTADMIQILIIITATSMLVMWIGELISEKGIGNGISLIIALGIIARYPTQIANTISAGSTNGVINGIVIGIVAILTIAVIVLINEAERKIPITYARRQAGPTSGKVDSYLPIKVNVAGVIPIIFALSFLTFPAIIARFLSTAKSVTLVSIANHVTDWVSNNLYYGIAYFVLVFVFTFFYTYIVFEPKQISENLQKQSSFIPGVRPGPETTTFLGFTINRLTVLGAIFLALIAILPLVMQNVTGNKTLVIGGTGILIVVSVVIETGRQLASQVSMRKYDTG